MLLRSLGITCSRFGWLIRVWCWRSSWWIRVVCGQATSVHPKATNGERWAGDVAWSRVSYASRAGSIWATIVLVLVLVLEFVFLCTRLRGRGRGRRAAFAQPILAKASPRRYAKNEVEFVSMSPGRLDSQWR